MPYRISLFVITAKIPFLNSLLISLHYKSVKRFSYIKTNISVYRGCFINIPIKIRWFSIIGFLVIGYFWGRL